MCLKTTLLGARISNPVFWDENVLVNNATLNLSGKIWCSVYWVTIQGAITDSVGDTPTWPQFCHPGLWAQCMQVKSLSNTPFCNLKQALKHPMHNPPTMEQTSVWIFILLQAHVLPQFLRALLSSFCYDQPLRLTRVDFVAHCLNFWQSLPHMMGLRSLETAKSWVMNESPSQCQHNWLDYSPPQELEIGNRFREAIFRSFDVPYFLRNSSLYSHPLHVNVVLTLIA